MPPYQGASGTKPLRFTRCRKHGFELQVPDRPEYPYQSVFAKLQNSGSQPECGETFGSAIKIDGNLIVKCLEDKGKQVAETRLDELDPAFVIGLLELTAETPLRMRKGKNTRPRRKAGEVLSVQELVDDVE